MAFLLRKGKFVMKSHEEEYDAARQTNLRYSVAREETKEGFVFRWFRIEREEDEPIPGLLVHHPPKPTGKLLLFVHGLGGCKEDIVWFREVAEASGFSMLAIDARKHGERKSEVSNVDATGLLEGLSMSVVDNRLAVDVALRNGWTSEGKVILVGTSMGGVLGSIIAGVDRRIGGAALYVPGGDLPDILAKSKEPTVVQVRGNIPKFLFRMLGSQLANIEPLNYIDKISPRPLLVQLGEHDDIVPFEDGMKLFERAKEPKDLVVHDSGHDLPHDRAVSETVAWMKKRLPSLAKPD
jgi:alpha-beta hydrolase superfamily lysophospholipase